jgi:hypothetical protein
MSRLLSTLLVRLHGSLQAPADQVPDAALLERFARSRDAAAFDLLFWRKTEVQCLEGGEAPEFLQPRVRHPTR